jgi:hypothetical protein
MGILGDLLEAAQDDGLIATDVTRADIKRLVSACVTGDPTSSDRLTALVLTGMRS